MPRGTVKIEGAPEKGIKVIVALPRQSHALHQTAAIHR